MFRWIPTIAHVWPGITPLNVWDLTLMMWLKFVNHARAWEDTQDKAKPKK